MRPIFRTMLSATFMMGLAVAPSHSQQNQVGAQQNQAGGQQNQAGNLPEQDPCIAGDSGEPGADRADATDESQTLTEKLDRCNGVLAPPPVGDTGLVEPAPDKGVTPVIPPSMLPEDQPPPSDNID